jgi:hypothetical protein
LDAATHVDGDKRPKPGDRSFCFHCGSGLMFLEDCSLRAMTRQEVEETMRELSPHARAVVDALASRRRRQRQPRS